VRLGHDTYIDRRGFSFVLLRAASHSEQLKARKPEVVSEHYSQPAGQSPLRMPVES